MSSILTYLRNIFAGNTEDIRRKRRRTEFVPEEQPFPIKYRRVSNKFPKTYNRPIEIDDEIELFPEVKQKKPQLENLIGPFLMDQQQRQFKAVIDDGGEFSDEEKWTTNRAPGQFSRKEKQIPFNFADSYRNSQPSTSSNFRTSGQHQQQQQQLSSSAFGDENDIKFVSINRQSPRNRAEVPSLIPITSKVAESAASSSLTNGHHHHHHHGSDSYKSISVQPHRGRKSVFDIGKKSIAFNSTPPPLIPATSVLNHKKSLDVKEKYDNLLMKLGCYNGSYNKTSQPYMPKLLSKPIATIDLSEENDLTSSLPRYLANYSSRSTKAEVDVSDDETGDEQIGNFSNDRLLSSTMMKSPVDRQRPPNASFTKNNATLEVKPVNSLKEKQANISACDPNALDKINKKFNGNREQRELTILEQQQRAAQFEKERKETERANQKRIDDSLLNVALSNCIIFDEEEEVIDEFPPLNDQQNRLVNFALYGARNEVIVSKFKMDVARYDFATLDGLNWLNDMVINFYLELIKERSEQVDDLPKVHVMNTVFLGKLLEQGYSGVRRWTRKVDIFSYDIIPVPVHVGGVHWCMSIIHLKNKTIKYYDSMGHPNYVVLEALENYLKEESMDKRKVPFDTSDWNLECVRDCPQQKNGSDCGVFSCQFAEFVSRDSAISFEQQHMPYFRRKMICEIASGKLLLGF